MSFSLDPEVAAAAVRFFGEPAAVTRLAPEFPHPMPVEDSFAGLTWLAPHAGELAVDPARVLKGL